MAQKPEDFNLPVSAISKIVKDAIPEGVRVTDGAKVALSKAASVFVLYATSSANCLSQDANRKRLLAKDVFEALNDLELDFLIPPLHNSLAAYRRSLETKKQAKESKKASSFREEEVAEDNMEVEIVENDSPDVITLDSESESEDEVVNNDSDSSSS
ncbi:DNA polymerase epsilon subunit 3-like [Stegodyphus dumicola]|uniref:DNA polymerase epsilon subunit 3-like n=1 Tax=Stegodyphus dumicola TaxID=202533 RepID=UPI0015AC6C28|nr:DNA polymerase epsilon subunit 3-like [Stegodyphus dumicola]